MEEKTIGELTPKELRQLRNKVKAYNGKQLSAQEIIDQSSSYGKKGGKGSNG